MMAHTPDTPPMGDAAIIIGDWLIHDSGKPPERGWGVVVSGERVLAVGPGAELRARLPSAAVIDASGCVIAPGFVNAHTHMYGVLAHGIPPAAQVLDFWSFLQDYWWPQVEDALDHAMIATATDHFCMESLLSGVTTFYDILEAPGALRGCLEVEAEVVRRWGLRGVLSFEATQRVSRENGGEGLAENADFIRACRAEGPESLIHGLMCFHTTFTCSADFIREAFRLGEALDTLVHFHCAEGRYEPDHCLKYFGKRPIEYYEWLGVLGPRAMASQCVQINPREIDLLAVRGAKVTSMPLSNCEVGGGFAPLPEMDVAGITLGLGTDGYVNNYFALMRAAFLMHKARREDPSVMPADRVWHLATAGGAAALGLTHVGALRPGYSADLILIDSDLPTPITAHNLREQLILWRDPVHVAGVMVAGEWRLGQGAPAPDAQAIRARTREQAARLWRIDAGKA
jgi:5-methylthioadenosine/S-adenosylhomocysteine deaminase